MKSLNLILLKLLFCCSYFACLAMAHSIEGELTQVGDKVNAGGSPRAIVFDPTGKFAYAVNYRTTNSSPSNWDIYAYNIDRLTGKLGFVEGLEAGPQSTSIAIAPTGKFVYMASDFLNYGYKIDAAKGLLSEILGESRTRGFQRGHMSIDSNGKNIYVSSRDYSETTTIVYGVDEANGKITRLQENGRDIGFNNQKSVRSVSFDPKNGFACVINDDDTHLYCYKIDPATNRIINNSLVKKDLGTQPVSISVNPNGKSILVLNEHSINNYKVDRESLALTEPVKVDLPFSATSFALDPTGKFAFVAVKLAIFPDWFITTYAVEDTSGAFTYVGRVETGSNSPESIAVDPSGMFVYILNGTISSYAITRKKPVIRSSDFTFVAHDPIQSVYTVDCLTPQQIQGSAFVFKTRKGVNGNSEKITVWGNDDRYNTQYEVKSKAEYPTQGEFDKDIGENYCARH